jgi:hypothetical protein
MTKKQKKYMLSGMAVVSLPLLAITLFYIATGFSQLPAEVTRGRALEVQKETLTVTDPIWEEAITSHNLAAESDIIVLGSATENKCVRTQDGSTIRTLYTFVIDQVVKGNFRENDILKVSSPGGAVFNGADKLLVVITPGYTKMHNDQRYLLFLQKKTKQEFKPTRGPQGIFEVKGTEVTPYSTYNDQQPENDDETLDLDDFLRSIS